MKAAFESLTIRVKTRKSPEVKVIYRSTLIDISAEENTHVVTSINEHEENAASTLSARTALAYRTIRKVDECTATIKTESSSELIQNSASNSASYLSSSTCKSIAIDIPNTRTTSVCNSDCAIEYKYSRSPSIDMMLNWMLSFELAQRRTRS